MSNPGSNVGKTLVAVATYNEIENLPALVDEIFRFLPAADLLVVDDNSPDGTGRWCDTRAGEDPRLHCLHRAGKLGLGTAVIAAMKYALANGYGYVLTMDADFSHPPKCLPAMMAGMNPAGGSSVRRDDRLALHPRRRRRGLAVEAALHEPRREPLRPLAPRPEAQGLQRKLPLLPDRDPRQAGLRSASAAGDTRCRKRSSGA